MNLQTEPEHPRTKYIGFLCPNPSFALWKSRSSSLFQIVITPSFEAQLLTVNEKWFTPLVLF